MSQYIPEEVKPYLHLLNNTGGNDPERLLERLNNEKNLSFSNIVVFTMAVAVESQVNLLSDLIKEGKLK